MFTEVRVRIRVRFGYSITRKGVRATVDLGVDPSLSGSLPIRSYKGWV